MEKKKRKFSDGCKPLWLETQCIVPHAYWGYYIDLAVSSSTVYALLPVLPPTNEPFQSLSFPGDLYTHGVAGRETWPTKTKWPIFIHHLHVYGPVWCPSELQPHLLLEDCYLPPQEK